MANGYDVLLAAMQIARGDTGAGGMTILTGKTVPLVRWEDFADVENVNRAPPIATIEVTSAVPNSGAPKMLRVSAQLDAWVERNSEGLESQIIDRLEAILTSNAFKAQGLAVAPTAGTRRTWTGLENGRRRESLDIEFLLWV